MANDKNRQRKLAEKAARRKAIVAEKKRTGLPALNTAARAALAAQSPIERCVLGDGLFKSGMGTLIVTRRLPSGLIAMGLFLLDVYCLGVKDAFYRESAPSDFEDQINSFQMNETFVAIDPSSARKLLRDAVAYAARIGFQPAKEFAAVEKIFGSIDADLSQEVFVFGYQGKPFYMSGPFDAPTKTRKICATLDRTCGPGNWESMIALNGPPSAMLSLDVDGDDETEDDEPISF